jgi:RimJ/RimL family protein N-acetyltransferase
VVEPAAFRSWWQTFLGSAGPDAEIFTAANVPNVAEGQIVHLHGLNLSRAGMLARIATALLAAPAGGLANGDEAGALLGCAERLYRAGAGFAVDGDYHSTHWLATFAWDAAVSIDMARARFISDASTQIVAVEDADFAWMLEGKPPVRRGLRLPPGGVDERVILDHVRAIAARLRERGCAGSWIVVSDREIVGLCGYKNAPSTNGEVEIGYGITPSRRRRGHASRAVAAVIAYARLDPPVRTIVAKTDVDNVASQTVLQRNGFERVGEGPDPEDGAPIVFWRLVL